MGAPQTPELAGSWLIYCLPCSVRLGFGQLGDSVPVRLGDQGVCHQGGLFWKKHPCGFFAVDLPWGSPNECPVLHFPGALGVSASRPAVRSLCGRSPQTRLQRALPGCRGTCLWEQFSGNPTVGPLRAGTASLILPSLTVSTEYFCVSPPGPRNGAQCGDLCMDSSAQTPGVYGLVWDECTRPDIIIVKFFFFKGPWFVSSGSKNVHQTMRGQTKGSNPGHPSVAEASCIAAF